MPRVRDMESGHVSPTGRSIPCGRDGRAPARDNTPGGGTGTPF